MSRVIESTGTLVREALATRIEIIWRPGDVGEVIFHFEERTSLDGEVLGQTFKRSISVPLADLLPRNFDVPLPEGGVQSVPIALVMGAIKTAVDVVWDEAAPLAPLPPP